MNPKSLMYIFLAVLIFFIAGSTGIAQDHDAVKTAGKANEKKSQTGMVDREEAAFLVRAADARMMGQKEGRLAMKKGTTPAIRQYGKLMVKDQTALLAEIRKIAMAENISLPVGISNSKEDGRQDLERKDGKSFDSKFIKMMIIDHKRDIRDFKEAMSYNNPALKNFAEKRLPTIEQHLKKIEAIKEME